jgi:hypothetical protein
VQAKPMHEVFAKTTIVAPGDTGGASITVNAVQPEANDTIAYFYYWPASITKRIEGFLLLQGGAGVPDELAFYDALPTSGSPGTFTNVTRNLTGTSGVHPDGSRVLQPRTWDYALSSTIANSVGTVPVYGDPLNQPPAPPPPPVLPPGAPATGYIVVDKEWMQYSSITPGPPAAFNIDPTDADGNGVPDARGWGQTTATAHNAGTPVTVAQEYPGYPGFYYTVQYYPVNATGAEARVIVTVGYGPPTRFRVVEFEGVYTPSQY